ncbi:MAG TPA: peptidoglycan-binding protein, partial [Candidatus Paceibacterota bacterium]
MSKYKIRKTIASVLVSVSTVVALSGGSLLVPMVASAQTDQAALIAQLQAQILALQAQLNALVGGGSAPASSGSCSFTRDLTLGSKGDDVTCLQNYLTGTGHFTFAGGATGYFGSITKAAVAAWQAANGVAPAAGYFGKISQAKYNSMAVVTPPPPPPPPP